MHRAGSITVADDDEPTGFGSVIDARLRREARRQGTTTGALVRAAVEERYGTDDRSGRRSFIGIGDSGLGDASERIDDYLDADFTANRSESR